MKETKEEKIINKHSSVTLLNERTSNAQSKAAKKLYSQQKKMREREPSEKRRKSLTKRYSPTSVPFANECQLVDSLHII